MESRHRITLADWYSRVVFGVIAAALAMLAGQGACSVEPVARAQSAPAQSAPCGSYDQPCFVRIPTLEHVIEVDQIHPQPRLRVHVVNVVDTR